MQIVKVLLERGLVFHWKNPKKMDLGKKFDFTGPNCLRKQFPLAGLCILKEATELVFSGMVDY